MGTTIESSWENEQLKEEISRMNEEAREWNREITRLRTENEALRRDAERYRWLREKVGVSNDHISGAYVWMPTASYKLDEHDKQDTDAAIDAAMKEST